MEHMIHFQRRDVRDLSHPKKYGFIITNPPYGERLEDKKDLRNCTGPLERVSGAWKPGLRI